MRSAFLLLLTLAVAPSAGAQDAPPEFPISELADYIPTLARAVELIGENQVEESFEKLETEVNPAFRSPDSLQKFHDSWLKLFLPLGRLRMQFESYDVVAYERISSHAVKLYGVANGANGPTVFDFKVFQYRGRWHVHGFSFRAIGWDRDEKIPENAVHLDDPIVYPLGGKVIAATQSGQNAKTLVATSE
ncbi:hypothetical protein GC176_10990 [bacterium]|nr:hypothetical protein [bacterium]